MERGVVSEARRRVRTRCFFNCGRTEKTGDRAVAINVDQKRFRCHQYGCGVGGGLLDLMWRIKHGHDPEGGRLRGPQFKEIAADLQAVAGGEIAPVAASAAVKTECPVKPADKAKANVPLGEADNEAAWALTQLDEQFAVEAADMNPKASQYSRRHGLSADVCQRHRCGYMPGNAKSSLRGWWVYGVLDEQGEALAWVGRDLNFEEKHQKWVSADREGREPNKCRFPKNFHRGVELYGQHWLKSEAATERLTETSLIVVEGFNDAIRVRELGDTAVAIMSNTITKQQVEKVTAMARDKAGGRVTLLFDNDVEGENGARQALWEIAQHGVDVRLAWSRTMHGGRFAGKQPEDMDAETWAELRSSLVCSR